MAAEQKKNTIPATPIGKPPSRVVVERVSPSIDGGRRAAKCAIGQAFRVEAIVICDGHEILKADIVYRHASETAWKRVPLKLLTNDRYEAWFTPDQLGSYVYAVEAAIDRFAGWRDGFIKKLTVDEATDADAQTGIALMKDGKVFKAYHETNPHLTAADAPALRELLYSPALSRAMRDDWSDASVVRSAEQKLFVDPAYGGFSAWYEFFPRSKWTGIAEQGNLKDAATRLDYVADLGFDIAYLPPIHPIGMAFRKGRNNSLTPDADDVGSPWAIGGKDGGHKAIHPDLGTFEDFAALVKKARSLNIEIALDIAFQCSPDHPYVKEHPEWFKHRPDGTIQYAENPPKKYQDIYPFDFECAAWESLWHELKSVITFWMEKGVRVFRVDNPHTKAFAFWEWCIGEIQATNPEVVFLAEAFTRPHVMEHLAKIGFNQSYTYFTWRHTRAEFDEYMRQLTSTEMLATMRPNFWPNTPDILTDTLQNGGRVAHVQRFLLAATLSPTYGIYGPVYELLESAPLQAGKEDFLNSEKYERREWDVKAGHSIAPLIKRVNQVRQQNAAFRTNARLKIQSTTNDWLFAFTRESDDRENVILVVANLDRFNKQAGTIDLQIQDLGISPDETYVVHDLLSEARYYWRGWRNFVELDPYHLPVHLFRIERNRK